MPAATTPAPLPGASTLLPAGPKAAGCQEPLPAAAPAPSRRRGQDFPGEPRVKRREAEPVADISCPGQSVGDPERAGGAGTAPAAPGNARLPAVAAANPCPQRGDTSTGTERREPAGNGVCQGFKPSAAAGAARAARRILGEKSPLKGGRGWHRSIIPACPGMSPRGLWRCLGTHGGCREGFYKEEMSPGGIGGKGKEPAATSPAAEPRRDGIKN